MFGLFHARVPPTVEAITMPRITQQMIIMIFFCMSSQIRAISPKAGKSIPDNHPRPEQSFPEQRIVPENCSKVENHPNVRDTNHPRQHVKGRERHLLEIIRKNESVDLLHESNRTLDVVQFAALYLQTKQC